jgi:hypothetical protein
MMMVEKMKKHYFRCCEWKWIVLCQLLLANAVCASHHGNNLLLCFIFHVLSENAILLQPHDFSP